MQKDDLGSLAMFLAVVDERSFTRAAAKLGISQSALSHAMRRLEEKLGLRLLNRTTRSVAPTDAGNRLIETLRPALADIDSKLISLTQYRERPAGTIRLTASEHAARTILWPVIDQLTRDNPDIKIELNIESGLTDIVAEQYDAGVRLGERLAKDMIAVRIGPPLRMAVVGAPSYFTRRSIPATPHDLAQHTCINYRFVSNGGLYIWEFEKAGREVRIKVDGQLVLNRADLMIEAAVAGHGIAFLTEDQVSDALANGTLIRVLDDWCEPFDGYHLYYASRRQPSPVFTLLLEALRARK
ncbi:LysR family transcriptional regulator [Tardiphaga sp. 709]|uniref:LysR family transcriptional regulator n=1 Tax=Tardiphaga sp. 709 TaxID=3076039 RepID=UPI0028EAACBF|nr:LysR family transcriptional regulator [Tardiphaga sp. 709]WNV10941.1 LysR family transcriptional regulator [Tardiphaga sp. 709]